jgi:hypothetical protein
MGALRDFVADMLESEGAVLEPVEPEGLRVLAPEPLRAALGWSELVQLGFGAERSPEAIPIGLEGDWLDRFGALLGERGRFAERQLGDAYPIAPPSDPERLLDKALDLPNAVWRLRDVESTWTRCVLLAFRYSAASDEKRDGLTWVGFNQGTGATLDDGIVEQLRALSARDPIWQVPAPETRVAAGAAWDVPTLGAKARPLVQDKVRRELAPFLRAMRRRLDRDRGRVHEYHDGLRRSAQLKLAALRSATAGDKTESDRKRETMRIAAIEREYVAKLEDLRHNYALRVTVAWVQGLTLFVPVQRFRVLIKRRKGERVVAIDRHPAIRLVEPPPCDWGPGLERTRLVCDDQLHLTDPSGQAPCTSCGKAWCRACHGAACPRCARTASTGLA